MKPIFRIAPLVLLISAITACNTTPGTIYGAGKSVDKASEEARQTLEAHKVMSNTPTSVLVRDELWVGGDAIQLTDRDTLPDFFSRQATFYQLDPVSFQEITSKLSMEFGTRIVLSPDAIDHLRALEEDTEEFNADLNELDSLLAGEPPQPIIGPQSIVPAAAPPASRNTGLGLVGARVQFTLQHTGTVASLLDQVTSKANLYWRWDKTHITIFRNVTKTFVIDSLPGSSTFSATVQSGANGAGGAVSPSSHTTEVNSAPESAWANLAQSVAAMVSEDGRFALSEQIGTLTITDTPSVIEEIEQYVQSINNMMGRKIAVRTEIYEVMLDEDGSIGVAWDAIFSGSSDVGVSLVNSIAGLSEGIGLNVIRDGSNFNGSSALIGALGQYADLSLVTSSSVFTTNGQPVPVQVIDETAYLAQIQTSSSMEAGGLSQTSLTPGVVTSGVSMSLLPRVESDGDIMMQVAMDLSQLNEMATFGSGDAQIQLPNRSAKSFVQRVSVRSGETLMVSGFERTESRTGTTSLAGKGLWMFGGKSSGGERKVMTLILITPYLMAE